MQHTLAIRGCKRILLDLDIKAQNCFSRPIVAQSPIDFQFLLIECNINFYLATQHNKTTAEKPSISGVRS